MFRGGLLLGACAALLALAPVRAEDHKPIKLLIITGDHVGHDWKATTAMLTDFLAKDGHIAVDVTSTPAKDLNPEKLAAYDVLLLNYRASKEPPPDTTWTDANKAALVEAVKGGKGLVVYHFASSAFTDWPEYETMTCGGWRTQGFHGPKHEFTVKETDVEHPLTAVAPSSFNHVIDELYSNSLMVPGNVVLATAYCDPSKDRGTGKDEPMIWVNAYGKGRVYHNALGHDTTAIADPIFQDWMRWGAEWAATGSVCVPEAAAK